MPVRPVKGLVFAGELLREKLMALLVVGSVAFDTVETPFGKAERVLGGSASFFSMAASFFTKVRIVAAVGDDFPDEHIKLLEGHGIDCTGVEHVAGKSFFWEGSYSGDMNSAETKSVELNVMGDYHPKVPENFLSTTYCFLANCAPSMQLEVLDQLTASELVVCDTMNHWIDNNRDEVEKVFARVNGVVLNDGEARMFSKTENLPAAAKGILECGPEFVVIKKGEHGAMLVTKESYFYVPAYPTQKVVDPTGAGDSFGGGLMGYLASCGKCDLKALKMAMINGTVCASINVEGFTLSRLDESRAEDIRDRAERLMEMITV